MTREESLDEEISAGGVVTRPGPLGLQVLVAEQRDRHTGDLNLRLPKGHPEPGESLEQAALREVAEEVGVEARILQSLTPVRYAFWHEALGRRVSKVVHYFAMAWVAGEARPLDGEMLRTLWCGAEEAESRLSFESERLVVREARALLPFGDPSGP